MIAHFNTLMPVIQSEQLWVEKSRRTLCTTIINETKTVIRFQRVQIHCQVEDLTHFISLECESLL